MQFKRSDNGLGYTWGIILLAALTAACSESGPTDPGEISLLEGRVVSSTGEALAGIPIRARSQGSHITVSVYSDSQGEYSFPQWSDLTAGSYSVSTARLPEFEPVQPESVTLSVGKTMRVDLTLQARQPSYMDVTATDIVLGLPGTEEQRFLAVQCDNCHSLQFALKEPHTEEEWLKIVKRMAGERQSERHTPGTRAFRQKQYVGPLAEYLASIRGPGSSHEIPFKVRPRPTEQASTRLVVTEYDIPRGGETLEPYLIRGDRRFAWPHDIIVDEKYGYYTDHFSFNLGRLDKETGAIEEFPFTVPAGAGRANIPEAEARAGNPGGGAHDLLFDSQGRVVVGARNATTRFDPQTEQFTNWPAGAATFGLDPSDNVWWAEDDGTIFRLSTTNGEVKEYKVPPVDGIYDKEADSQGRFIINVWGNGKMRVFDPKTETHTDYPTPTPASGPRRGDMDSKDRQWVGLYWAGRLGVLDPNKGEVREFPLVPGSEPFGEPFPMPYSTAVDDKNQLVWTSDFNSSRIFLFDMQTETTTEFFMPHPYEVRDLTVDEYAERPTLWIPDYRPPSKMVKVQLR